MAKNKHIININIININIINIININIINININKALCSHLHKGQAPAGACRRLQAPAQGGFRPVVPTIRSLESLD